MNSKIIRGCLGVMLIIGCLCAETQGQKRADDPLDQVKAQIRRKEYQPALKALRAYLNASTASVGDPNIEEAKTILLRTSTIYATSLEKSGNYLEAANVLLDTAAVSALSDQSDALLGDAKASMQRSFKVAINKHEISDALAISNAYSQRFPSDAPLMDPRDQVKLQLDALASIKKSGRPSYVLREYKRLKSLGATDDQLHAAGLVEPEMIARYAEELLSRGWYLQAASFARTELTVGTPSPEIKACLGKIQEQALGSYFDACKSLGNARMITDASALYGDSTNEMADARRAATMESFTKRMADKQEPKSLVFAAKFVEGKGTWMDDGTGYTIPSLVQIGNWGLNWGGPSSFAEIVVRPGMVITGGHLRISTGVLTLKGSVDRPIVLKNLKIECDHRGHLIASNTIFLNCHFAKSGNRIFSNGFSSKWELTDCLLVNSGFDGLSKVDYGIKLQRCTFVGVSFPDRTLTNDAGKDNTGLYHHGWNTISDCQLYQCVIPPSLLWANGKSAFLDCKIGGESTFASSKPLQVELYLPKDDSHFVAAAQAATKDAGKGNLTYHVNAVEWTKLRPSPLWHFVPNLPDVTEKQP